MNRFYPVIAAASILLASCAKELPADKREFVGLWKNNETSMLITASGRLDYKTQAGSFKSSLSAPITALTSDKMTAGILFFTTDFAINRPPKEDDGVWSVVIDGKELFKTDALGQLPQVSTIPKLERIQEMTRADLGRLGDAIKSNDFSNYISHASLTYQSQFTNQSAQQAFKQLVDKKIELEQYLAGDMLLTSEPSISPKGTLALHGRYGSASNSLGFDLTYVHSGRQWALSGARIAVTKTPFADGDDVPIETLQKEADSGSAEAQNTLANRLAAGDGIAKNEQEAVKWYRTAAEQGYARAQNNLGVMYDQGAGVPQNQAEAAAWYRKAAAQGYAMAQNNLGLMLANGIGVKKNLVDAASWYEKAAFQGDVQAQYNLGHALANGSGVKKNRSQAALWLRKAADHGDAQALEELNAINSNRGGGKVGSP